MDGVLGALEATALAQHLRFARWSYAAVSALHILGVALLIGAVVPLDLRLLGFWRGVRLEDLARVLAPIAAAGLALAISAGLILFSVRAREYAALDIFQLKLALVATGALTALAALRSNGLRLAGSSAARNAALAVVSLACWLGALACGRLIAFVGD